MAEAKRRAVGITRVSFEGGRQEPRLHSFVTQAAVIRASCEQQGMTVEWIGQERVVSGGADLANRPELSRALAAIEAGEADVIVAAYTIMD